MIPVTSSPPKSPPQSLGFLFVEYSSWNPVAWLVPAWNSIFYWFNLPCLTNMTHMIWPQLTSRSNWTFLNVWTKWTFDINSWLLATSRFQENICVCRIPSSIFSHLSDVDPSTRGVTGRPGQRTSTKIKIFEIYFDLKIGWCFKIPNAFCIFWKLTFQGSTDRSLKSAVQTVRWSLDLDSLELKWFRWYHSNDRHKGPRPLSNQQRNRSTLWRHLSGNLFRENLTLIFDLVEFPIHKMFQVGLAFQDYPWFVWFWTVQIRGTLPEIHWLHYHKLWRHHDIFDLSLVQGQTLKNWAWSWIQLAQESSMNILHLKDI